VKVCKVFETGDLVWCFGLSLCWFCVVKMQKPGACAGLFCFYFYIVVICGELIGNVDVFLVCVGYGELGLDRILKWVGCEKAARFWWLRLFDELRAGSEDFAPAWAVRMRPLCERTLDAGLKAPLDLRGKTKATAMAKAKAKAKATPGPSTAPRSIRPRLAQDDTLRMGSDGFRSAPTRSWHSEQSTRTLRLRLRIIGSGLRYAGVALRAKCGDSSASLRSARNDTSKRRGMKRGGMKFV
jgi:hypothetical protein